MSSLAHRINPQERYDLRDQLGKGSYGTVFKAVDTHTSEVVAVKIIPLGPNELHGLAEIQQEIEMLQVCETGSLPLV